MSAIKLENLIPRLEAAKLLENIMSISTLDRKVKRRTIPHFRDGYNVFFDREQLQAWAESKRVQAR